MTWLADNFQVALFLSGSAVPDPMKVWREVFGNEPSSYQRNPPGGVPGGRASDIVDGVNYTLSTQPGRVDLFCAPDNPLGAVGFTRFRDAKQVFERIVRPGRALFESLDSVRVALVVNMTLENSGGDSPQTLFSKLTGIDAHPEALDLSFSSNLRAATAGNYLRNRLDRYEAAERQVIQIQAGPMGAAHHVAATEHGLYRQLDLNSVPTGLPLPRATAVAIFDEFAREAEMEFL